MRLVSASLAAFLLSSGLTPPTEAAVSFPIYLNVNYCWGGTLDTSDLAGQCTGPDWVIKLEADGTGGACELNYSSPTPLALQFSRNGKVVDIDLTPSGSVYHYMGKILGGGTLGGVMTTTPADPLNTYDGVWSGSVGTEADWLAEGCL